MMYEKPRIPDVRGKRDSQFSGLFDDIPTTPIRDTGGRAGEVVEPRSPKTRADTLHNDFSVIHGGESRQGMKIGERLVSDGVLTKAQVDRILDAQQNDRRVRGMPFGRIARKMRFATRSDIDAILKQDVQGSFRTRSMTRGKKSINRELCCMSDKPDPTAESIRSLRTQLLLRGEEEAGRGVAVSIVSPDRKEGRSFIAANLAVAFAQSGRRTLLVDADMRSPRLHLMFGADNDVGFSSLLMGASEDHPVYTALENLYLVPAGSGAVNPQDLLCRDHSGHWLDVARNYFDAIVLDTPAANDYADAQVVSSWVNQTVVVVRRRVTRASALKSLGKRLADSGIEIAGFVMNDT